MNEVKCISSYSIPTYSMEEIRVRNKLKLGIPLTDLDYEVITHDLSSLKSTGISNNEVDRIINIKYPNIDKSRIPTYINE